MTAYVAPASKVFTAAHIPSSEIAKEEDHQPETVCGLVMEAAEVWLPVTLRPGDAVCAFCVDPAGHKGAGEQGMLL